MKTECNAGHKECMESRGGLRPGRGSLECSLHEIDRSHCTAGTLWGEPCGEIQPPGMTELERVKILEIDISGKLAVDTSSYHHIEISAKDLEIIRNYIRRAIDIEKSGLVEAAKEAVRTVGGIAEMNGLKTALTKLEEK